MDDYPLRKRYELRARRVQLIPRKESSGCQQIKSGVQRVWLARFLKVSGRLSKSERPSHWILTPKFL
jgi:hypothetical protein